MKNKYTPAPWYPVNYGGFIHIQSTDYYENTDILDEEKCPQAIANAQLASSAPELLELALLVHNSFGGGNIITFSEGDIKRFEEVINKALGE